MPQQFFLIRIVPGTNFPQSDATTNQGDLYEYGCASSLDVTEHIVRIGDGTMKTLNFVVNQLCFAHKCLGGIVPDVVYIHEVFPGEKLDVINSSGTMVRTRLSRSGKQTKGGLVITKRKEGWTPTRNSTGGLGVEPEWVSDYFYDAERPVQIDFLGPIGAPRSSPFGGFVGLDSVYELTHFKYKILVQYPTVAGHWRKNYYTSFRLSGDFIMGENGQTHLEERGELGRNRWRRFVQAMTYVMPFLANYRFDDKGILVEHPAMTFKLNLRNVSCASPQVRNKKKRGTSDYTFRQEVSRLMYEYMSLLYELDKFYLEYPQNPFGEPISTAPIVNCAIVWEKLLRVVAQSINGLPRAATTPNFGPFWSGTLQPIVVTRDCGIRTGTNIVLIIRSYLDALLEAFPFTSYESGGRPVVAANSNAFKRTDFRDNRTFKGAAANPVHDNFQDALDDAKLFNDNIKRWFDLCYSFMRVFAVIEKLVVCTPISGLINATKMPHPQPGKRYKFWYYENGYYFGTDKPMPGKSIDTDATSLMSQSMHLETIPQCPSTNGYEGTGANLYKFYDYHIPTASTYHPYLPGSDDDEGEEPEEEPHEWHNVIIPLTPEEEEEEAQSLREEIADGLIDGVTAVATLETLLSDGLAAPVGAVEVYVAREAVKRVLL